MLALDDSALILIAAIATVTMATLAVIYRPLVLECFDPSFLRSVSPMSSPTHFLFLVLVVLNLVGGFQALGTLMVVGIMLLPAITARFWAQDISNMIVVAVASAFAASFIGLLLSYYANLPTGPAIILTMRRRLSRVHAHRHAGRPPMAAHAAQTSRSLNPRKEFEP